MAAAMTVTATQGGTTANGMALRVMVLTGVAAMQNGATATQSTQVASALQLPVTTTVTGSQVYGGMSYGSAGGSAYTANGSTTLLDQITDATNGERYFTCRTSSPTGTPGSVTVGSSTVSGFFSRGIALAEILPNGTITEDASSPAEVDTTSATAVTTASFTPPDGSLLVAMIGSDGGGGVTTMALSGGGLTWAPLAEANSSANDYAGVWIAQVTPAPLGGVDDPVITATQGGTTFNGISLRIFAVTGALPAALQTGATGTQSGTAAHQASITTTVTGSRVYAALIDENRTAYTANGSTTLVDNITDSPNFVQYGSGRSTALTGTPGAVTIGATAPADTGSCSLLEILPAAGQTLAESGLSPPVATSTTATAVSTASFSAPSGSLLVAIVSSDGGTGTTTMAVTGGGLTWIEKVHVSGTGLDYSGIWVADVPGADSGRVVHFPPDFLYELIESRQRWFDTTDQGAVAAPVPPAPPRAAPVQARQLPQPGGRITSRSGLFSGAGAPVRAAAGPVRARIPQPLRGGHAATRRGPYGGLGPVLKAFTAAVAGTLRGLPPRGRTATRAGAPGTVGPAVKPAAAPVRAQPPARRGGSTASRSGTFTAAAPQTGPPVCPLHGPVQSRRQPQRGGGSTQSRSGTFTFVSLTSGPPVYPLHGPVQARRLPQRGGSTSSRTGAYGRTGPQVKPLTGPVKAQPPPQRGGHTASRSGTLTAISLTTGPPLYPLGHPAQARRLAQRGGAVSHRAGPYAGRGPAVPALKQPLGLYRQQPPPPARGRVMSAHGAQQPSGPPVPPLHRAIRARLPVPVLTGRARTTLYPPVATPPPPFTIGTLTASGAPSGVLAAGQASSALTAATASTATLTAAAQTTGGPS